jgi:transcriptional regulator with XRE-family HTH domain
VKNNIHLGRVIKQLLEQNEVSFNAAAEKLDYTVQALYPIFEKEDVNTSLLKKLGNIYNVPLSYFFNPYLWVNRKSSFADDEGVNQIASRVEDDVRLTLLESENKNLKEQNELLREMLDMYKAKEKNGTNSGTK